jgi:hypothetical protein
MSIASTYFGDTSTKSVSADVCLGVLRRLSFQNSTFDLIFFNRLE